MSGPLAPCQRQSPFSSGSNSPKVMSLLVSNTPTHSNNGSLQTNSMIFISRLCRFLWRDSCWLIVLTLSRSELYTRNFATVGSFPTKLCTISSLLPSFIITLFLLAGPLFHERACIQPSLFNSSNLANNVLSQTFPSYPPFLVYTLNSFIRNFLSSPQPHKSPFFQIGYLGVCTIGSISLASCTTTRVFRFLSLHAYIFSPTYILLP